MLEEDFYRTYSKYLKDIYGEKVYKLPVKLNLSCPNRDGNIATGGCIFCGEEGGSFENSLKITIALLKYSLVLLTEKSQLCPHQQRHLQSSF